jgi:energy-coupling factor transporter ATP-binding protein EcfA2
VVAAGFLALGVDALLHHHTGLIKWRIKHKMRNFQRKTHTYKLLPIVQSGPSVTPDRMLLMLLGPTGCGKTTRMETMANEAADLGRPVAFVKLRAPPGALSEAKASQSDEPTVDQKMSKKRHFEQVSRQICDSVGYPKRDSIIFSLMQRMKSIGSVEFATSHILATNRIGSAFTTLFDACEELYDEGKGGEIVRPVIFIDEIQDLIKDNRLANAGGHDLLEDLAADMVRVAIDNEKATVVVAGSSAALHIEFDNTAANSPRWDIDLVSDPSDEAVSDELLSRGYSSEEINALIATCGTRLRLLRSPLCDPGHLNVRKFVVTVLGKAEGSISKLLGDLGKTDRDLAIQMLDALATDTCTHEGDGIPSSLRNNRHFSSVFFIGLPPYPIQYQSATIKTVWKNPQTRKKILKKFIIDDPVSTILQ